jgi:hypothetical protein
MNIIKTKDTSRHGNDCYIYETVSLVEQFGIYAIIFCQKISGWAPREDIYVVQTTSDRKIAEKMFNDYTDI